MSKRMHLQRINSTLEVEVDMDNVYTSIDQIKEYIKETLLKEGRRRAYILLPPDSKEDLLQGIEVLEDESNPDVVIVGFDTTLTYEKLAKACLFIERGVDYILIHPDIRCPTEKGFIPDAGSIGQTIKMVTGKPPKYIGGKPNPDMLRYIAKKERASIEEICFIGDRVYTDMKMALNAGALPVLFLTGEVTFEELIFTYKDYEDKIILGENPKFFLEFLRKHIL